VDYPATGKAVTVIVPWAAGGPTDIAARIVSSFMEKELKGSFPIVNKAGAGSQVGLTDLAKAKPDGYTIAATLQPNTSTTYVDPDANALYSRKDFLPIAMYARDCVAIGVRADSPYKTLKDLIDAAKAKPEGIKFATTGPKSPSQLGADILGKQAGVKFATVGFDSGGQMVTALMGGHVDVTMSNGSILAPQAKTGEIRVLAIADKNPYKFYPNVPTLPSLGYNVNLSYSHGYTAPAGTPKEIVDILMRATKAAVADAEVQKKLEELYYLPTFLGSEDYAKEWDATEALLREGLATAGRS